MLIKNYKYFKNLIIYLFCILICAQANSMHCNTVQQEQTHYYTNINNIPNEVYQVINNIYHARINNYSNTNIWSRFGTDYISYNGGIHYYSTKPWHNREQQLPILNSQHNWWPGNNNQREFYIEHDIIPYNQGINRGSHRIIYNSFTGESFYTADHYNSFVRIQRNWTNDYTFIIH